MSEPSPSYVSAPYRALCCQFAGIDKVTGEQIWYQWIETKPPEPLDCDDNPDRYEFKDGQWVKVESKK